MFIVEQSISYYIAAFRYLHACVCVMDTHLCVCMCICDGPCICVCHDGHQRMCIYVTDTCVYVTDTICVCCDRHLCMGVYVMAPMYDGTCAC